MASDPEVGVGEQCTGDCDGECDNKVKVHVTFANYGEDEGPPVKGEWLWATPVDEALGHYRLDNIPFFADFGYHDIVSCDPVTYADGVEIEREIMGVIKPSGNLTTRLYFKHMLNEVQRRDILLLIESHEGVGMEWAGPQLATISLPPKWTGPAVLGHWVKSGVALSDLFTYDENGVLLQ